MTRSVVNIERFLEELPTSPVLDKKILVTGGSGCVGGLLVPVLLERGYTVRVMVRSRVEEYQARWPQAEIAVADALEYTGVERALQGIDCAFYFIHSLNLGTGKFPEVDRQAAINFREAAEKNNLERIIYLGNLGEHHDALSAHLRSRLDVAEQLQKGKTPVTFLRSAVVVGAHSTSYKIIKYLILNCPVLLIPKWGSTLCQPVAIRNVIQYLVGCLEVDATIGRTLDIGGKSVLSYAMMLKVQAEVFGRKRIFIPTRFSVYGMYARIASIFTPVRFVIIKSLMQSCANEVVCKNQDIQAYVPCTLLTYKEALVKATETRSEPEIAPPKTGIPDIPTGPPTRSKWPLSDVKRFLLHKPQIPTLIKFNTKAERENYGYRILQRLGVGVDKYSVLNIHKIGVNAPAKYIFEELMQWDGDSTCWPNNIARVTKKHNQLENLHIHLFGWTKFSSWLRPLFGENIRPLFRLEAMDIKTIPDETISDNARYMLYHCTGGYPIGIFLFYVRSSIPDQNENEQAQLFMVVGFNFYGKDRWPKWSPLYRPWEMVHDRVTANVLNRIKQLSEWRFSRIQHGSVRVEYDDTAKEQIVS